MSKLIKELTEKTIDQIMLRDLKKVSKANNRKYANQPFKSLSSDNIFNLMNDV
jgi:hypothetical protein